MYPFTPWRRSDTVRLVVFAAIGAVGAAVLGVGALLFCLLFAPWELWKVIKFLRGDVARENARLLRQADLEERGSGEFPRAPD